MFPRILVNQTGCSWKASCFGAALRLVAYNPLSCFSLISQFDERKHSWKAAAMFRRSAVTETSSSYGLLPLNHRYLMYLILFFNIKGSGLCKFKGPVCTF